MGVYDDERRALEREEIREAEEEHHARAALEQAILVLGARNVIDLAIDFIAEQRSPSTVVEPF